MIELEIVGLVFYKYGFKCAWDINFKIITHCNIAFMVNVCRQPTAGDTRIFGFYPDTIHLRVVLSLRKASQDITTNAIPAKFIMFIILMHKLADKLRIFKCKNHMLCIITANVEVNIHICTCF
jgi:hypothetical protein